MKDNHAVDLDKTFRSLGEEMVQVVKEINETTTEVSPFVLHNLLRIFYEFLNRILKTQGLNPAKPLQDELDKLERRINENTSVLSRTRDQLKNSKDAKSKRLLQNKIGNTEEEQEYLQRIKTLLDEDGMRQELTAFLEELLYTVYGGENLSMAQFKKISKEMVIIFSRLTGSRAELVDIQESAIDLSNAKPKNWFERWWETVLHLFHHIEKPKIKATGLPEEKTGIKEMPDLMAPATPMDAAPQASPDIPPDAPPQEGSADESLIPIEEEMPGELTEGDAQEPKKGRKKGKKAAVKKRKGKAILPEMPPYFPEGEPEEESDAPASADEGRKSDPVGTQEWSSPEMMPGEYQVDPDDLPIREDDTKTTGGVFFGKIKLAFTGVRSKKEIESLQSFTHAEDLKLEELKHRLEELKKMKEHQVEEEHETEETLHILDEEIDNLVKQNKKRIDKIMDKKEMIEKLDGSIKGLAAEQRRLARSKKTDIGEQDDPLFAIVEGFVVRKRKEGFSDASIEAALLAKNWPIEYIRKSLEA